MRVVNGAITGGFITKLKSKAQTSGSSASSKKSIFGAAVGPEALLKSLSYYFQYNSDDGCADTISLQKFLASRVRSPPHQQFLYTVRSPFQLASLRLAFSESSLLLSPLSFQSARSQRTKLEMSGVQETRASGHIALTCDSFSHILVKAPQCLEISPCPTSNR